MVRLKQILKLTYFPKTLANVNMLHIIGCLWHWTKRIVVRLLFFQVYPVRMLITQRVVYRRKFKKKFLFPFFEKIKDVELCKIISKCLLKFLKIFYQVLKENSWNLTSLLHKWRPRVLC